MKFKNKNKDQRKHFFTKFDEKIIALSSLLFLSILLIGGLESNHLYSNYKAYENLNDIREEVNLDEYKPENYIVKNETLNNMEEDIIEQITSFYNNYQKEVGNIEQLQTELKATETNEEDFTEQYDEAKKIVKNDLDENIKSLKTEIKKIDFSNHDLSENEQKRYDKLEKQFKNIKSSEDLEILYNNYTQLESIKTNANDLMQNIKERENREKKERQAEIQKEQEEQEELEEAEETMDFSNLTSDLGVEGSFDRGIAQNLFDAINVYRSSLGLAPYSYNTSMQSCIDQEAQAYGTNGNPHNWVCPDSNENASNAPVGSDAVSISMDFFMTDPPHEAVLSGPYSSAAVSVYQSGGTNYIIVGVF